MSTTTSGNQSATATGLTLGALGVVFGDIGTSPLYAFEVVFADTAHAVTVSPQNILGVLSLFIWSLMLVVTLKYVLVVMRFDNSGEGGIVALMTLLLNKAKDSNRLRHWCVPLGMLGAALFYGDSVITPAISVLSAVEGLETVSPQLGKYVVPVSMAILIGLFVIQRQGTERISRFFGPVMLVWFILIALLGLGAILRNPSVLSALNPWYAVVFVGHSPVLSFFVLGAVVLCMTGAEALYADMGHFGAKPIQRAWIFLVFPALVLNYLGQGALVLHNPEAIHNPFFKLAPDWSLQALVGLATLATVIASQAVISGVFSITQQLVQLRVVPRMSILHTSNTNRGQVYLPAANWLMLITVLGLVLIFQSSNAMAGAYGIAVTGTMLITDIFIITALVQVRGWRLGLAVLAGMGYVVIDSVFFASNLTKISQGGWFPVLLSVMVLVIIASWMQGVKQIQDYEQTHVQTLSEFLQKLSETKLFRSAGTGVFLTSNVDYAPPVLVMLTERFQAMPQKVICLNVHVYEMPFVRDEHRFSVVEKSDNVYLVVLRYGYRDEIDIPVALKQLFPADDTIEQCQYLINRWSLTTEPEKNWWLKFRKHLFIRLFRNATPQARLFEMPPDRVTEVGERFVL